MIAHRSSLGLVSVAVLMASMSVGVRETHGQTVARATGASPAAAADSVTA